MVQLSCYCRNVHISCLGLQKYFPSEHLHISLHRRRSKLALPQDLQHSVPFVISTRGRGDRSMAPQYHVLFTRSTAKCGKYAVSVLPAGFSRLPSGLGSFLGYSGSLFGGEDFSPGLPTLQPSQPSKGNSGRVLCGWVLLLVGGGSVVGVMGWFAGHSLEDLKGRNVDIGRSFSFCHASSSRCREILEGSY